MESTENALESIDWTSDDNRLFLNHRMKDDLKGHYRKIFKEATYRHGLKGQLGFLTSGTTVTDPKGYKIVLLSKESFLTSAKSVNKYFILSPKDLWMQCLPRFHVGGMAIEARSYVGGFPVAKYLEAWDPQNFYQFLVSSKSTWTSLVPTQVYDLVKANLRSPKNLRVLVGGARISPQLIKLAKDLGWNLIPSYGMTELASTIGIIENETIRPLPHVQLEIRDGKLAIKSQSLMTAYVQVQKGQIELTQPQLSNGYFLSEDAASRMGNGIMLLGRTQDVVKISGELVSFPRLRDIWFRVNGLEMAHSFHIMPIPDPRTEFQVAMVMQNKPTPAVLQQLGQFQSEVMPFERIQRYFLLDQIPRTELGKVQEKQLQTMIEKGQIHEFKIP